jgi:hypothetical protein
MELQFSRPPPHRFAGRDVDLVLVCGQHSKHEAKEHSAKVGISRH